MLPEEERCYRDQKYVWRGNSGNIPLATTHDAENESELKHGSLRDVPTNIKSEKEDPKNSKRKILA